MYRLRDEGVLQEIESGNDFGYVLENSTNFVYTDYKVLQSQTSGIFVKCMKMIYNGKIELFYLTEEYRPMSSLFSGMKADTLLAITENLFANVIEVRNNGFLSCQNIDLSWDKIYVDEGTLKVRLIYLPLNIKVFDSYATFENELRSGLVKLINKIITTSNSRLDQFVKDLCNSSLTMEEIYNKSREAGTKSIQNPEPEAPPNIGDSNQTSSSLRMVALNAPTQFEINIDRDETIIGKKADLVDEVVPYNQMISRKHCKVMRNNGVYYIVDLGSVNGTYVNNVKLLPNQSHQMNKGDIIQLADSRFQIE